MVYPSQGTETKTMILHALEGCTSLENGIGYNKLFEIVNSKVGGSRRTFHKYLSELISAGAVRKDKDPRHKAGVVIYKTSTATQQEVLMKLAERISEMSSTPPILKNIMLGRESKFLVDWKMLQLSDMMGRSLCHMIPFDVKGMTYAYARITNEGKKAELNLISEDGKERTTFSREPRKPLPMIMRIGHVISIPLPPNESAKDQIMEEFRKLDLLGKEWQQKSIPLEEKALSYFPKSERELILKELHEQ
jgi:hypothetical protein